MIQGEAELKRMRLEGRVPSLLYIDLDVGRMPGEGHLRIPEADRLSELDLRIVQGLVVSLSGCNAGRTKAIAAMCTEAGARRVIANILEQQQYGFEMVEVTDTEGTFTWSRQ